MDGRFAMVTQPCGNVTDVCHHPELGSADITFLETTTHKLTVLCSQTALPMVGDAVNVALHATAVLLRREHIGLMVPIVRVTRRKTPLSADASTSTRIATDFYLGLAALLAIVAVTLINVAALCARAWGEAAPNDVSLCWGLLVWPALLIIFRRLWPVWTRVRNDYQSEFFDRWLGVSARTDLPALGLSAQPTFARPKS